MLSPCRIQDVEAKYYANGEDAYEMRKYFTANSKSRRSHRGDKRKSDQDSDRVEGQKQPTDKEQQPGSSDQQQSQVAAAAAALAAATV